MSIEQMRQALIARYPGDNWANKVKQMPDSQVLAIYSKFVNTKQK